MKFRYRFERILRTRKLLENKGIEELQRLKSEKERHSEMISQIQQEWDATRKEGTPREGSASMVSVILDYLRELSRLEAAIKREQVAISRLEDDIEQQRQRVVELYQQRRIFEKVKERDLKRHLQEVARQNQKEMDEHVTIRHGRTNGLPPA